MSIHLTRDALGTLSVDAVGAVRIEADDSGLFRILIDTEDGESLVLAAPAVWLELHEIPPTTETVTVSDPFVPRLCLIEGEMP